MDAVAIKEYKFSESGCLINLLYFRNTFLISISNFVLYWAGNNNLPKVDSIQSVINLQ